MDFTYGDRLDDLLRRVRSFMDEHVYPVEAEGMAALDDEVKPGVPYPEIIVGIREKAKAEGHAAVSLSVEADSPAVAFYERNGFEPAGKSDGGLVMVKRL